MFRILDQITEFCREIVDIFWLKEKPSPRVVQQFRIGTMCRLYDGNSTGQSFQDVDPLGLFVGGRN